MASAAITMVLAGGEARAQTDPSGAPAAAQNGTPATQTSVAPPPSQTAAPLEGQIIVTGSRIKRTVADIDQPAEILGSREIEQRG